MFCLSLFPGLFLLYYMKIGPPNAIATCDKSLNMGNTGKKKNIFYLL